MSTDFLNPPRSTMTFIVQWSRPTFTSEISVSVSTRVYHTKGVPKVTFAPLNLKTKTIRRISGWFTKSVDRLDPQSGGTWNYCKSFSTKALRKSIRLYNLRIFIIFCYVSIKNTSYTPLFRTSRTRGHVRGTYLTHGRAYHRTGMRVSKRDAARGAAVLAAARVRFLFDVSITIDVPRVRISLWVHAEE